VGSPGPTLPLPRPTGLLGAARRQLVAGPLEPPDLTIRTHQGDQAMPHATATGGAQIFYRPWGQLVGFSHV
jgi:hypothetical protein